MTKDVPAITDDRHRSRDAHPPSNGGGSGRPTPVSPAGDTPPDQDSEPPRTAVPPDEPASPGARH
jgi:hypothetical protein